MEFKGKREKNAWKNGAALHSHIQSTRMNWNAHYEYLKELHRTTNDVAGATFGATRFGREAVAFVKETTAPNSRDKDSIEGIKVFSIKHAPYGTHNYADREKTV